jgi:hypothetical protein
MDVNVFAIIVSLVINVLRRFSSHLSRYIVSRLYKQKNLEIAVWRDELRALHEERSTCNPMDEFAKFALINRRINKLVDCMQTSNAKMRSAKVAKQLFVNAIFTGIVVLMSLMLIVTSYDRPVVDFSHLITSFSPADHNRTTHESSSSSDVRLFYPVDYIISFPCTHRLNSIGVTFWLLIVNRLVEQLAIYVQFLVAKPAFKLFPIK